MFTKLMRRSMACLLLLAMLVSLTPNVFAAEKGAESVSFSDLHFDVPAELKNEDVVVASFGENGGIVYEAASEEVRAATRADVTDILTNRAGSDLSAGQRLAFFIDPSNSEGNSNYSSYTLTATIVRNLVAAGVTDLFVMTKTRGGTFDLSDLKIANSNKGTAKVYAWMHCARDDAYLTANTTAGQYHFRAGYNNSQNGADTSVAGWVHLANAGYISYMEGLVAQAASCADGLLLDSVRFGTEFTGWGDDCKSYMGLDNWNAAVEAMCASAYDLYGSTYRYSADSDGYYQYVSSGGSTNTSGSTLADIITSATAAAKSFGSYRKSVITGFVGKMKTAFGTSAIIAVALERDWENTNYYKYVKGQDPYNFRNHVKNGFCVTMQVMDYHTTDPVAMAKNVAKYTNVMIGVDFYKVGTYGNYGYTYPDTITDLAESIYTARYTVNGDYASYRGSVLGAACYTAGHIGAMKVSLSNSGTTPTLTATVAHPNQATTAMMSYFNIHGDSDCGTQTSDGSKLMPSGSTMQYFANKSSSGAGAYGYIGSYSTYTGANVSAFGSATIIVALKNYTVDWDKLPFARIAFYVPNSLSTYLDCVGHFPIYTVSGHESCSSFSTTVLVTPTCAKVGYTLYTCTTCGYDYVVEAAKSAHTETSVVTTEPTCISEGVRTYTCSVCSNTRTEAIAAGGHSYEAVVTPATCLSDGYTTYTCSVCGDTYTDDVVSAGGHNYVHESVAATCTSGGCDRYTCSGCGDFYEENVTGAIGHSYATSVVAPTCTEAGYTTYTCSACGDAYTYDFVAALGHSYRASIAVDSTCTETGVMAYTCSVCGDSYREEMPLAGHTYSTETVEATCLTGGYTIYTCADCGYSYEGNFVDATGHAYDISVTEPTCTEGGYTTYTCTGCGDSYVSLYTAAKGHNYEITVVGPTCTEGGYTLFLCACGDSYTMDEIDRTGHSYSYTDNGDNHIVTCENCGESTTEDHELNADQVCTLCGAQCCKHTQTSIVVDAQPTCTTDGSQRYVCDLCGQTVSTETLIASGHDPYYVAEVAATCTESGSRDYWSCYNCGGYYTDASFTYALPESYLLIAATGHSYEAVVTDPTCTDGGYTTYTCSGCSDSYVADEIAATGHSYGYTDNGEDHTITCAACGDCATESHNYTDGVCICGAVESTEPAYNSALSLTMNISVGAEMQVMYTILNSKVKNYDSFYVEVVKDVVGSDSVTTTFSIANSNLTEVATSAGTVVGYTATYTGIFAMEMGDNFTATLYAVDADGNIYYGDSVTASIKSYLMEKLADSTSSDELKTLAVDMLNYGAAAQVNFTYDTENLVNADLTDEQKLLGTQETPSATDSASASGDASKITTSVSLQSKVLLYVNCAYAKSDDSNLEFVVKNASTGEELERFAPTIAMTKICQGIYGNVGARQMRDLITVELYDNGALVSQTLTWSIESYVAQVRADSSSSDALIATVNAMLTYGDSAAAYLTASGQ